MKGTSATIVCPTLDLKSAAEVCHQAASLAGIPTAIILVVDLERRGGVIPGNAALAGAVQLNSPYIAYLNDDVVITQQGWLKRLVEVLESNSCLLYTSPSPRDRS